MTLLLVLTLGKKKIGMFLKILNYLNTYTILMSSKVLVYRRISCKLGLVWLFRLFLSSSSSSCLCRLDFYIHNRPHFTAFHPGSLQMLEAPSTERLFWFILKLSSEQIGSSYVTQSLCVTHRWVTQPWRRASIWKPGYSTPECHRHVWRWGHDAKQQCVLAEHEPDQMSLTNWLICRQRRDFRNIQFQDEGRGQDGDNNMGAV